MKIPAENFKDRTDDESDDDNTVVCFACGGSCVEPEEGEDGETLSVPCSICKGEGVLPDERDEFSHADDMED